MPLPTFVRARGASAVQYLVLVLTAAVAVASAVALYAFAFDRAAHCDAKTIAALHATGHACEDGKAAAERSVGTFEDVDGSQGTCDRFGRCTPARALVRAAVEPFHAHLAGYGTFVAFEGGVVPASTVEAFQNGLKMVDPKDLPEFVEKSLAELEAKGKGPNAQKALEARVRQLVGADKDGLNGNAGHLRNYEGQLRGLQDGMNRGRPGAGDTLVGAALDKAFGIGAVERAAIDDAARIVNSRDVLTEGKKAGFQVVPSSDPNNPNGRVLTKDLGNGKTIVVRIDPDGHPGNGGNRTPGHGHIELVDTKKVVAGNYPPGANSHKFDGRGQVSNDPERTHQPLRPEQREQALRQTNPPKQAPPKQTPAPKTNEELIRKGDQAAKSPLKNGGPLVNRFRPGIQVVDPSQRIGQLTTQLAFTATMAGAVLDIAKVIERDHRQAQATLDGMNHLLFKKEWNAWLGAENIKASAAGGRPLVAYYYQPKSIVRALQEEAAWEAANTQVVPLANGDFLTRPAPHPPVFIADKNGRVSINPTALLIDRMSVSAQEAHLTMRFVQETGFAPRFTYVSRETNPGAELLGGGLALANVTFRDLQLVDAAGNRWVYLLNRDGKATEMTGAEYDAWVKKNGYRTTPGDIVTPPIVAPDHPLKGLPPIPLEPGMTEEEIQKARDRAAGQ